MTHSTDQKREMRDLYTVTVLDSLDKASRTLLGNPNGWTDSDLSDLMPAITRQFERAYARRDNSEQEDNAQ